MQRISFYVVEVSDDLTRFYHLPPALPARTQEDVEKIMHEGYDLNDARDAMQWVIENRPDFEHANAYRSFLIKWPILHESKQAMLEQRYDDALIRLDTIVTVDNEDPSAYYHLGLVFRYMQRFPDSETSLRRCLELYPELAIGHRALGYTLAYMERKQEAIHELEIALMAFPEDTEIISALRQIRAN